MCAGRWEEVAELSSPSSYPSVSQSSTRSRLKSPGSETVRTNFSTRGGFVITTLLREFSTYATHTDFNPKSAVAMEGHRELVLAKYKGPHQSPGATSYLDILKVAKRKETFSEVKISSPN